MTHPYTTVETDITPLPWRWRETGDGRGYVICGDIFILAEIELPTDEQDQPIPGGLGHEAANAAFIVRAVNAFPELVTALEAVEAEYEDGYGLRCIEQARAALARAKATT